MKQLWEKCWGAPLPRHWRGLPITYSVRRKGTRYEAKAAAPADWGGCYLLAWGTGESPAAAISAALEHGERQLAAFREV